MTQMVTYREMDTLGGFSYFVEREAIIGTSVCSPGQKKLLKTGSALKTKEFVPSHK